MPNHKILKMPHLEKARSVDQDLMMSPTDLTVLIYDGCISRSQVTAMLRYKR